MQREMALGEGWFDWKVKTGFNHETTLVKFYVYMYICIYIYVVVMC
jgi:hypothetical protein